MQKSTRLRRRRLVVLVAITGGVVAALIVAAFLRPAPAAVPGTTGANPEALTSVPGVRMISQPAGLTTSKRDFIDRMTIHHTESAAVVGGKRVDANLVGQWHVQRGINEHYQGAQAAAYHFIILPDGTVQAGRPLNARGSGTLNLLDNGRSIGVVLVGDFSSKTNNGKTWPSRPTAAQLKALTGLSLWAFQTFHFGPANVHGHREVGASDCPGDRFGMDGLRKSLATAQAAGQKGVAPPIVLVR